MKKFNFAIFIILSLNIYAFSGFRSGGPELLTRMSAGYVKDFDVEAVPVSPVGSALFGSKSSEVYQAVTSPEEALLTPDSRRSLREDEKIALQPSHFEKLFDGAEYGRLNTVENKNQLSRLDFLVWIKFHMIRGLLTKFFPWLTLEKKEYSSSRIEQTTKVPGMMKAPGLGSEPDSASNWNTLDPLQEECFQEQRLRLISMLNNARRQASATVSQQQAPQDLPHASSGPQSQTQLERLFFEGWYNSARTLELAQKYAHDGWRLAATNELTWLFQHDQRLRCCAGKKGVRSSNPALRVYLNPEPFCTRCTSSHTMPVVLVRDPGMQDLPHASSESQSQTLEYLAIDDQRDLQATLVMAQQLASERWRLATTDELGLILMENIETFRVYRDGFRTSDQTDLGVTLRVYLEGRRAIRNTCSNTHELPILLVRVWRPN